MSQASFVRYKVTYKHGGVQEDFIVTQLSIRGEKFLEWGGFSECLTLCHDALWTENEFICRQRRVHLNSLLHTTLELQHEKLFLHLLNIHHSLTHRHHELFFTIATWHSTGVLSTYRQLRQDKILLDTTILVIHFITHERSLTHYLDRQWKNP